MRSTSLVALSSIAATAMARTCELGPADVVNNNPMGARARATFPGSDEQPIRGSVVASTAPGGVGVNFAVQLENLPEGLGPYSYHVHVLPVEGTNCTTTLAHQDPYVCYEDPPCDPADPANCQVGDLSGKHGTIENINYFQSYVDRYASLVQGLGSFVGNRSIVVHDRDSNRLTCANFVMESQPLNNGTQPPSSTGGYYPPSPTGSLVPPPTGGAVTFFISTGAVAAALFAYLI